MSQEPNSLDSLGLSFGTDKSSLGHDYLRFYEEYFEARKNKNIKLLEIGLAAGASLRVWEEYFRQGVIIGADINPATKQFARPRVIVEIVDQADISQLMELGAKHGPFDIIIEDGSHMWEHQINSLKILFPFLVEDGIYVIEDLQTNFGYMQKGFRGTSDISCVEYLKKLVDIRVGYNNVDLSKESDPFLRAYGRALKSIIFYRESCLIEKCRISLGDEPFLATDDDHSADVLDLTAHIGCYGDRKCETAVVRGRNEMQNIQGFVIGCRGYSPSDLQYRARLQNGVWTNWVQSGDFVGTRGRSEDLTGLSVRLTGKCFEDYSVDVVCAFRGMTTNVIAGDGEDCVPADGLQRLWGFQIILRRK